MALALNCGIPSTPQGRELVQHGSALFPIACYEERLTCYSVPWHWHEDFEYILAYEGTVTVGVDKKRICLAEGEGVFINSGVLHAVEFAAEVPQRCAAGCSIRGSWAGWTPSTGKSSSGRCCSLVYRPIFC